jgi:very-short-patch-repair endonuclease/predicted transcriptional regulator of viral defense system
LVTPALIVGAHVTKVDRAIAEIAARQHGVISRVQLLALGLSTSAIDYRLAIGRLHRIEREVYAVGHAHVTQPGRWLASVLTCGDAAVLSHRSAGAHLGIAPYDGRWIDVTARTRRRSRGRIKVHRARLEPEDTTVEDNIPLTTVARTVLDLAAIVDLRRVERALERAEKLDLFDLREIERTCARATGHHGLRAISQALALYMPDTRTRSELERDFRDFCRDHDLTLPQVNVIVAGHEVDALWADAGLIVELDSWEHHRDRAAFERDRVRDAELRLAGYTVIRITYRRLREYPEEVAALIRRCLT